MSYTDAEIIAAARAAVEECGADYVYPESLEAGGNCHYAEADGAPSCLIGHIIKRLYPALFEKIAADDDLNYNTDAYGVADAGFDSSPRQQEALFLAQVAQDAGSPWGIALETLEDYLS